jgi:T5SS/PEP-CTERM-associated repeat protein
LRQCYELATEFAVAGGSATNTFGSIGELAGSSGTVNVSSGTWANSGDLYVGYYDSPGTLTIAGGVVSVGGILETGTGGLNLGTTGSPGVFDLSALTLNLVNSGNSVFEITSPAFTAGTFDLVNGDGSLVFGGILNLAFSGGSYAEGTDVLQLFANTGGRSGSFSAVNATGLAAGQSATFNPVTGTITVVAEPSTYAISAIATAGLASLMRWRKQRTRERSLRQRTRLQRSTHAGQGIARCSARWCFWSRLPCSHR